MATPDFPIDIETLLELTRTLGLSATARKTWYPLLCRVSLDGVSALETSYATIMAKYAHRFKSAIAQYEALVVRGEAEPLRDDDEKIR